MRCPYCNRITKRFLYGIIPQATEYCKKCDMLFRIERVEPFICAKCEKPIIADAGKFYFMANNTVRHKRCPRR